MRTGLWLAGVGMLLPGMAQAQEATVAAEVPPNIAVSQRARPDYEPVGGRLGSFFLYPRIDVTGYYTSNLRAQEVDAVSDFFFDIRPSARLISSWTRHSLQAEAYYNRSVHINYPREDYSQYGGNVSGRYDYSSTGAATLTVSAARVAEPRTDINSNLASRSPISFTNLSLSGGVSQDFNRLGVSVSGNVNRQDFNNGTTFAGTPLLQDFRDNVNYSGTVEGRMRIGANTRVLARGIVGGITYDDNPFAGFDRNSTFYRIEAGFGLTITDLLSGSVTAGYYSQNNNDPLFIDSSGLSFSADLLYSPTSLTTVRLVADRSIEPGGSTITSGNVRGSLGLSVEHELRPDLILIGSGRYSNVEPQGPIEGADEYSISGSAIYYLNRRFRFNGGVTYAARKSDFFAEYDAVSAFLGVSLTL